MTIQDLVCDAPSRNKAWCSSTGSRTIAPSRRAALFGQVSEKHRIPVRLIDSDRRRWPICRARWEIMAILHEAGFSYPAIASAFRGNGKSGKMHHTTVMHGVRRHYELAA